MIVYTSKAWPVMLFTSHDACLGWLEENTPGQNVHRISPCAEMRTVYLGKDVLGTMEDLEPIR